MQQIALNHPEYPETLRHIAMPPSQLYVKGAALQAIMDRPRLAVVGSRKISLYGKAVTAQLVQELARSGIVIVSGLAFGVDAVAHRAALEAGGTTVAVLACGVDRPYPASHQRLAGDIIAAGGAVISEYPPGTIPYKNHFIARNRIVSALADGVLITEAALKSGSLHTARFALEQGKEVLAVPGNITSETSVGANNLIRSGATPITQVSDILNAMGWQASVQTKLFVKGSNPEEQAIIDLLQAGTTDGESLQQGSGLAIASFNQTMTMLEITGKIRPLGGNQWGLR
ncbi:MAG TPA: DNA-processing protein DprA [Candidatus Saccharimonadales bacterium]|nr:DNA-processing protein DprA [Candidatus Saccharimonadales bacterium]